MSVSPLTSFGGRSFTNLAKFKLSELDDAADAAADAAANPEAAAKGARTRTRSLGWWVLIDCARTNVLQGLRVLETACD